MQETERSVLHVLPHAGGGGDTYVDVLGEMRGYRLRRVYVAGRRKPGVGEVAAGLADLSRALRGYDLLHVHGEATSGLFLPLLAARPSIVTLHGLHLLRRVEGLGRRAAALNLHAVVRAASRTICVSNAEREHLAAVVGRATVHRVVVVHNGVRPPRAPDDAGRAHVRAELGVDPGAPLAIWVGSLDERRDPFVVIRAAMRTSTPLVMVGDGPLRSEAERIARPPVDIVGQRDDVPRLLAAADFFVLMSEREGLSFGLLEAMAHGLPAIVADIPENLEAVGDTGLAVPYGDEPALVAAFGRLAGDAAERTALGERARRRVAAQFDANEMVERTRAIYDEVVGDRDRRSDDGSRSV
jgi:glycosyltransferase involved in cell wall biosynthesis